jgi:hypothetical protein
MLAINEGESIASIYNHVIRILEKYRDALEDSS